MTDGIRCSCSACGSMLHAPASAAGKTLKCPKCGAPVSISERSPSEGAPNAGHCSKCGGLMETNARFCPQCGAGHGTACPQCGQWSVSSQKFCSSCGFDMGAAPGYDKVPVLTVRPRPLPWTFFLGKALVGTVGGLLPILVILIVLGLAGLFVYGTTSLDVRKLPFMNRLAIPVGLVIAGILAFVLILSLIGQVLKRKNLEKTEYRFYKTRFEYYQGFGTVNYTTIPYAQIEGVMGKQGWWFEKRYGVGDIVVDTLTEESLVLEQVPDFQKTYQAVANLMTQFSVTGGRSITVGGVAVLPTKDRKSS